ncbi:ATP-binding protein [Streptomyces sp. NPDC059479]|uniref:ATP-binding protein n=1 Tax=Streptomyces sp. NPDC059479 TaxID=3346848 RepID=UPI0036A1BA4D
MTAESTLVPPLLPPPPSRSNGQSYRLVVPNSACAPRIARDFVGSLLRITDHPDLADDARLCVTEVVTNSHRHTCSQRIRVDVTVRRREVTVYVEDNEPRALPVPGGSDAEGAEHEHGRGLLLVENLSVGWGMTIYGGCTPESKVVWFTLAEDEIEAGTGTGAGADSAADGGASA